MKGLLVAAVISAVACTVGVAKSGSFFTIDRSGPLYTTEDERLVSAIAGSILNIAAFADRFDAGEPFQVRNISQAPAAAKFSLARRAEVFTVEVGPHVWTPRSYGRVTRSFMADGAGLTISEDPAADREDGNTLVALSSEGLEAQNARLSRLLEQHPRSAALHEHAALLLAAAARRNAAGTGGANSDIRPLLCRMTAHLAVARALHGDVLSKDGLLAERFLAELAQREEETRRPTAAADDAHWTDGPVLFGDVPQLSILPPQ